MKKGLLFIVFLTKTILSQTYYPLSVNNYWVYGNDTIKVVKDTVIGNGRIYKKLNKPDFFGGEYVRCDSNYIWYINNYTKNEARVFNLKGEIGDVTEFDAYNCYTSTRIKSMDSVIIFGEKVKRISYTVGGVGAVPGVIFSEKFGPAVIEFYNDAPKPWPDRTSHLTSCLINNQEYKLTSTKNIDFCNKEYDLNQNYPNPFNPVTKINFTLAKRSNVELKVYDILGKQVALLVKDIRNAGSYSVEFNGSLFPSGCYLAKISTGDFTKTIKMSLIK